MCGIVYSHNIAGMPVNNEILNRYDNQRSRGVEGFGLFDGQEMNMVKETKEDSILKWLVKYDSNLIMFHHRYPTSTINVKRAAHPFSTREFFGDNQYILVHNGVLRNADELYEEHKKLGIKYESELIDGTFNDSEALSWDFALTMEGKQKELKSAGSIAFICIKTYKGELERLYFGRNNNPLVMERDSTGLSLSSEGAGIMIDSDTLYNYNYALNRLTKSDFEVPSYVAYEYNYPAYTPTTHVKTTYTSGSDYWEDWDEEDELSYFGSSDAEIENKANEYLIACGGDFEQAYWCADDEYNMLVETFDYSTYNYLDRKEIYLLEDVMGYIDNHPEKLEGKKKASVWERLFLKTYEMEY